jgi:hypothetical protein
MINIATRRPVPPSLLPAPVRIAAGLAGMTGMRDHLHGWTVAVAGLDDGEPTALAAVRAMEQPR